MAFIALTGGAYQARGLQAGAQSCVNLMSERVPPEQGEPVAVAAYPTPGLRLVADYAAANGGWRGIYRATNGTLFGVVGDQLVINSDTAAQVIGTLATSAGPVSMVDDGVELVVVDGSAAGYVVTLAGNVFGTIGDPAFYGADRVACLDGYFVFNRPGTNQFYLSNNVSTSFNPLYIAAKAGLDTLNSLLVNRRELWLFGERYTEIWSDAGAADFPLAIMAGGIEHGCAAAHSVTRADGLVFWLDRSRDGQGVVLQGANYQASRVSTHAIEAAIQSYPTIADAVGWTYQLGGHTVYALSFPAADATWCYDLSTQLWHKWESGAGHRHRGGCHAAAYGVNLVGDWQDGRLYALSFDCHDDAGAPIQRTRAFPHIRADANRVFHHRLIVDMQCGTVAAGQPEPVLSLRWTDDNAQSWSTPVTLGMGAAGAGNTSPQFRRLGMARSRVYEVSWAAPMPTVLAGAWLETGVAAT